MTEDYGEDISRSFTSRWRNRLLGVRAGFGDGRRAIEVARRAERRRMINWTIPVLGILFISALLLFHRLVFDSDSAGFGMMFRVFLFDYSLFVFGGISGYNMARKWRANADQVEELSLTPLSPAVLGVIMQAGLCSIWLTLLTGFCVVDIFTAYADADFILQSLRSESGPAVSRVPAIALGALSMLLTPVALAWFHFESVRLAHWMFVPHSMPRVSLLRAGVVNFITMSAIVVGFSAIGSMITGISVMIVAAVAAAFSSFHINPAQYFGAYSVWSIAAIPGLLLIACLKRLASSSYQKAFLSTWLLYQWWGAGESRQPGNYPLELRKAIPLWSLWYAAEEEEIQELPEPRRRATARLRAMRARALQAPVGQAVTEGKSSDFPSRLPDPRSEPSHEAGFESASGRNSVSPTHPLQPLDRQCPEPPPPGPLK